MWKAVNWRKAVLVAVAAAATLGVTSVAQAHGPHWKRWRYYAPYYTAVPGYYAPYYTAVPRYYVAPPVVYAPPAATYYPEPMAYAPTYPNYYAPPAGVNFNFTVPLR
jgi:hypothetical protein